MLPVGPDPVFNLLFLLLSTRHLSDENGPMYWEDTGEPILDETDDGYSVYYVDAWQNGRKQGRCIHPDRESTQEWEVIN